MSSTPQLVGIVNITRDSFSDGGLYLDPAHAIARARALAKDGADLIDLGPASSHPDAETVSAAEEIRRLTPVVEALLPEISLSVDSYQPETQLWALRRGVAWLNDIEGFRHPEIYPELAASEVGLVVMHSIQRSGHATREHTHAAAVLEGMEAFFAERIEALVSAGVARERLVLDPGMGFFLGATPEPSLAVLRSLPELAQRFSLPLYVSVSRKSFLGALTGRRQANERGAATLAAEIFAARAGASFIRTHDVGALRDALRVWRALESG